MSLFPAEGGEIEYHLGTEWTEAADGSMIGYYDGDDCEYIASTITARLTPNELVSLETAWQSATRLYTITSSGYLLGPTIDMSAGTQVRLMDYVVDQSADSAMTLYDVTLQVHYGPLGAPSAGSLAYVMAHGRPYHAVTPGAAAWITEGGSSDINSYSRVSTRRAMWYCHGLTTAQAADAVNFMRSHGNSELSWVSGGSATPWGPSQSGSADVWIPSFSVRRESNLTWGVEMELVRNG